MAFIGVLLKVCCWFLVIMLVLISAYLIDKDICDIEEQKQRYKMKKKGDK